MKIPLCFLSISILLSVKALPNSLKNTVPYCLKNDTHVRVFADIKSIESIQNDADIIGFRVRLTVHVVNISSEAVVILAGEPLIYTSDVPTIGPVALAKTKEDALACKYFFNRGFYPSLDRSAVWSDLRRALDVELPPDKLTRTLVPGSDWGFERSFTFGVWNDLIDAKHALDVIRNDAHVWFQVQLLMWPNSLEKDMLNPDFGPAIRTRWASIGHLIIEDLRTEPISISLPVK